jgi:hypothetical protein
MAGIWLGYVDYTLDTQEPFYVGKGREARVKNLTRNNKHQFISRRHGIRREVVVCSLDEKFIIAWEIETIAKLHTYRKDPLASKLACNESAGGEGRSRPRFPEPRDMPVSTDWSDMLQHE